LGAGIRASASFEAADGADGHVVVAHDLAGQAGVGHPLRSKNLALGRRPARWLSFDELDAAGGAPRVAAARVQDIDARILLDRQDESFAIVDVNRSESFNRQFRHAWFLLYPRTRHHTE
jgi:hypothetical protein